MQMQHQRDSLRRVKLPRVAVAVRAHVPADRQHFDLGQLKTVLQQQHNRFFTVTQRQRVAVGIFRAAVFVCSVLAVNFAYVMQQGGNGRLFVCKVVIFVLVVVGVDDLRQLTVDGNAMCDQPAGEVVMKFC